MSCSSARRGFVITAALLLTPAAGSTQAASQASVYRCVLDGVATYSDRPCGLAAEPYSADTSRVSTYSAPPLRAEASRISATRRSRAPKQASQAGAERKAERKAEQCRRIAVALKDLRSRMRAGYRASEAGRLDARERRLKERWRQGKCR